MRFLSKSDFSRSANKPDIMSDIATFKIPKGMVYAFSTRMNLSIYIQEYQVSDGVAGVTTKTLTSSGVQCPDLGASATAGENMKGQIAIYDLGVVITDWDIVWATSVITPDSGIFTAGTANIQIITNSTFNTDPAIARAAGTYNGTLEIRAEAPAGQNIGIPIFSGDIEQIHGQTQADMLTPLKLDGAVLLPEGFVLAVKLLAPGVTVDGTAVLHTSGLKISDDPGCVEAIRIPYERFALRDFPRDFKARVLVSMSQS